MTVFKAYYDASGADGAQGHLVVVGLDATEKKWSKFEKLWEGVLTDFGVTYFHMREFAHSRREYKTWKGNPLAREILAQCHAESHHRSVKAGQPPVPCIHCGRDYPWHVREGVYWPAA